VKLMHVNPCPWCDTETATIHRDSVTWKYVVVCTGCHAHGPRCGDEGTAVRRWNGVCVRVYPGGELEVTVGGES